ncbi:MAG TPA: anaerobic ribonucleoside-triphosphate reductase [Archaeoglobus profundus]|nr:anaerobic ribonucleoside-triphosphate reductase [Archaeoglobus profundus]
MMNLDHNTRYLIVRTSQNTIEKFDKNKIVDSLIKETGISKELAEEIANDVENTILGLNLKYISAPLIREIVNVKLLERGLEKERLNYTRLGVPVYDVTNIIEEGIRENANLQHNPETIHKLVADWVMKEYALVKILPIHLADAHMRGEIHIHDLEYFATRPYCFQHDLRWFLKNGLKVDGTGENTAVAGPAKNAEVAILHAAKALAAAQTNFAGGQGLDFFNVWLAPYLAGKSYKEIKQLAQMFIYEMSQMYVARGGQTVFSDIDIEYGVPKVCEDLPAVLPGGVVKENVTYGDFEDEAIMFAKALTEVYLEGDYVGKPFFFPKPNYKIRKEFFKKEGFDELMILVHKCVAKFGTPYFLNLLAGYMPDNVFAQCCRLVLAPDSKDWEDFKNGCMRTGSLQVVTINLPRIAYESNGDDEKLFELLEERMKLAREVIEIKEEVIRKRMEQGALPFLTQDVNGEPYYRLDKVVRSIGFVGLNEMLKAHVDEELHESKYAWRFGLEVIKRMLDIAVEWTEETGVRWVITQTPAESASHRLALLDLKEFNGKAIVQGDRKTGAVYYTNSSHVRVSADIPLFERLKIEGSFHPLCNGGMMAHVWIGESYPNPELLWELTKKIANKTLVGYWAYTKDMTFCKKCKKLAGGIKNSCPFCGNKDVEWYSRITGYYQRVSGWNNGKRRELLDRRKINLS